MSEWQPIETAPMDGTAIVVKHDEVGSFVMAWNAAGTNALFAPGRMGMWEASDQSMTWCDQDGCGPSHWAPLDPPSPEAADEIKRNGR